MKKVLFFIISLIIGILLFGSVIRWVGWQEIEQVFMSFSGYEGLAILFLTILIWFVSFWRWHFILKSKGCNYNIFRLIEIFFASASVTYFFTPPAYFGEELFRAYSSKKRLDIPSEKNFSVIAIEKILGMSVLAIFLVVGIIAFFFLNQFALENFRIASYIIMGLLIIGLIIFYFRSFNKKSILKYILRFLDDENESKEMIKKVEDEIFLFLDFRRLRMWKGLSIASLKYVLILTRCWLLIYFLTGQSYLLIPFAILAFFTLASIMPFPARLGGLEISQAFVFGALGLGTATGITFSLIIRVAEMILAVFGLVFLIRLGTGFLLKKVENIFNRFKIK